MEEMRIVPEWDSFTPGVWQKEINVRDFIQKNYTPYEGDESFLSGPTEQALSFSVEAVSKSMAT